MSNNFTSVGMSHLAKIPENRVDRLKNNQALRGCFRTVARDEPEEVSKVSVTESEISKGAEKGYWQSWPIIVPMFSVTMSWNGKVRKTSVAVWFKTVNLTNGLNLIP